MKKNILFAMGFYFFIPFAYSQNIDFHRLKIDLNNAKEDTAKVWLYMDAFYYYHTSNLDSTLYYLDQALELSQNLNYIKGQAAALSRKGNVYKLKGNDVEMLKVLNQAMPLAKKPEAEEFAGKIYQSKAHFFMDQMATDSAFYYLVLAQKSNAQVKPYNNWIVYVDMSNNALLMNDDEKVEFYLLQAYELSKTKNFRKDHGYVLYFLMDFYFVRNRMKAYAPYAAEYLMLTGGDQSSIETNVAHQILYFFDEKEDLNQRIKKMENAISVQIEQQHWHNLAVSYDYLSLLKKQNKDWTGALKTATAGLELAQQRRLLGNEAAFFEIISDIYEQLGDDKSALFYLKKYQHLEDSLHVQESEKNLKDLEVKYETEKTAQELALSQLSLEKKSAQNRALIFGILGAGLVTLVTLWFLYFKSKTNQILTEKNGIIAQSLKEKEMLLREIHHRVKNNLQVVSSLLSLQSKTLKNQTAKNAILEGQNRVKSMALIHQNLYQTDNFTGMDIKDYIEKLCQSLFHSYNIQNNQVQLLTDIDAVQIDVDTLIPLGLILNEVLSNALKHAFPDNQQGKIEVILKKNAQQLMLHIKDNGIGISEEIQAQKKNTFGLTLIKDFARKLEADLKMDYSGGTNVQLLF